MVTHHGQTFKLSDNVLVVLFAPDSVFAVAMHNVKNVSIVFKLTYGETSVLFTGDLEHEGDELLLPYENILKADILKIAHHGSITNTTEKLLYFIQPEYAIVSVGKKNKFNLQSYLWFFIGFFIGSNGNRGRYNQYSYIKNVWLSY